MADSAIVLAGRMRMRPPLSETALYVVLFWRNGAAIEGNVFGTRFTSEEAADDWARRMIASKPEQWSSYEVAKIV